MESNMYIGKINIIAIGLHKDEALLIINDTEYITVHKKFISHITNMIQIPYSDKNEFKFQFFHVLDGIKERNCFIQLKDGKFEVNIDSIAYDISENLLQSFTLAGFLKRFISIEEKRNCKTSLLQSYNEERNKQNLVKDNIEDEIENQEGENIESVYGDVEGIPNNETDIRLQTWDYDVESNHKSVNDNVEDMNRINKIKYKIFGKV